MSQVGSVSGGRGNKGFAAETAAATGKSKRSINRALQRAQAVAPEVKAEIQGTELDRGANLDALAKMEPEEQKAAVAKAKASGKPLGPRLVPDTDDTIDFV